jgi:hypothetical protein
VTSPDYSVTLRVNDKGVWPDGSTTKETVTINGTATLTVRSTTRSGIIQVTADAAGLDQGTVNITSLSGTAVKINIAADPPSITADGLSTSDIVATVVDINNNAVSDVTGMLLFTISGSYNGMPTGTWTDGSTVSTQTIVTAGTGTIRIKSTATAGTTIKVTGYMQNLAAGSIEIQTVSGKAERITATLGQTQIFSNGTDVTTVTVRVTDLNNNPVSSYSGKTNLKISGPMDYVSSNESIFSAGTAEFIIRSQKVAGRINLTVTELNLGTTQLALTTMPKQTAKLELFAWKKKLVADGTDSTVISAVLKDADNNFVSDSSATVTFTLAAEGGTSAAWSDGTIAAKTVIAGGGIATIEIKSSTKAYVTVQVAGSIYSTSYSTVSIETIAQQEIQGVKLNFEDGTLTATGNDYELVTAVVTDKNGNYISGVTNTINFRVEGEAEIVAGTNTVRTSYADVINGVATIQLKSTQKSGNAVLSADISGVAFTSVTVASLSDIAYKIVIESGKYMLTADNTDRTKISVYVKDINDNTVTGYNSPVNIKITGSGYLDTGTQTVKEINIYPAAGVAETELIAGTEISTITVTATTTGLSQQTIKLFTKPEYENKVCFELGKQTLASGETAVLTVKIIDRFGNTTPIEKTVTMTGTGLFNGDESRPYTTNTGSDGKKTVIYTGTTAGSVIITGSCSGLADGTIKITVTASTKPASMSMTVSTPVYTDELNNIVINTLDENGNRTETTNKIIRIVNITRPELGDIITSTETFVINGEIRLKHMFRVPGVYELNCQPLNIDLSSATFKIIVLLNKKKNNTVTGLTENGKLELVVQQGMVKDDVAITFRKVTASGIASMARLSGNKPVSGTNIELVAQDVAGNDITDMTQVFNTGGYVTLSLPYLDKNQDGLVDATANDEQNLRIGLYNQQKWIILPAVVNTSLNTVTAQITAMGIYAVIAMATEPTIEKPVVYPNPFAETTNISFLLGSYGSVKLDIYTVTGRLVRTINKQVNPGDDLNQTIVFDGNDDKNEPIANGTYLFKINTKNGDKKYSVTGKAVKAR